MADQVAPGSPGTPMSSPETAGPGPSGPRTYGGYGSYGGYGYDGYGGYGEAGPGAEAHLMDYVRKVYRHRWLALTTFAVILIGAAVNTFSTTPIYEGRVQLQLDPETPNVMSFKEGMDQAYAYGYEEYYYQTQYTILKSRGLARRTIESAKLWDSPEFGGGTSQTRPSFSLTAAVRGAVRWAVGLFYSPPRKTSRPDAAETARQSGIIDAFLGRLSVTPVRNSRLVDVRFVSSSPEMAATMANALANEYIAQNLEYKFRATKDAAAWLGEQLALERKKLEDSEQALQRYREKGDAVALEDRQNIVVQRLTDLNAAYTKARTDRFEKEALYNQLKNLQNDRTALDTFPAILSNSFIQQLKSQLADLQRQHAQMADRLGEKHPDMIKLNLAIQSTEAKLDGEIAKVVQSVHNEFLSAQAQERSLAEALSAQKSDALSLNRTGIEYGVLRREAESNKQMYELLMQRTKETGISGELKTSNIRIVDPAEIPRSPIRPNKSRDLALGLLAGLLCGVGLALFMEYIDNRVKNPDEIKNVLGLSFLGLVPALREKDVAGVQAPLITDAVPQNFAEAFRAVRTNVLFSSAEQGSRSVLVTSTQPREGKTVVTVNLALALAQTGQRVLLIDGDMRKPRQHELLNVTQDPGLSSLLVGTAKANDAIRKTGMNNLWLHARRAEPAEPGRTARLRAFQEPADNADGALRLGRD